MHQGIYNQASAHFYCARNFNKFGSFLQKQWYRFTIVFAGVHEGGGERGFGEVTEAVILICISDDSSKILFL